MLKKILLALIFVITAITNVTHAEDDMKTVASKAYVDTQIETKQLKIPAAGQPNVGAGETVMTYTTNGNGEIGERGLYSDISSYNATTDGDKLITASALNATFTNLPTTPTTKLECANESDGCTLWTIVDQTAYGDMLPSGYTRLEYIQSTGTQYIDTGITALETDEITVIGTATTAGSQFFFSQGASSNNQAFQLANTTATNGIVFDLQNYDPYRIITGVYAYNNVVTVRIANKEIFVNGTSYGTSAGTLTNPTDTMRLFISSAGAMYNIQMQRFTITGKIDLVPAKNSNNVIGMYDTVSGTFFTNAATSGPDFTPGPPAN